MKLTIELVPKTAWYSNVRSNVSSSEWDILRKDCYVKANHKCEICGGIGHRHPVEAHEVWEYNNNNKTQTLKRLIALCPNCHKTKHVGLAKIRGEVETVINQLMNVNGMNRCEALEYIDKSFDIWRDRSQHEWELNIDYIKDKLN